MFQAEFNQEQEYLKTLSYLSAEEQQRYKERQSVSFMYMKPPGLDAALAREGQAAKEKAKEGSESEVATTGAEPGADASNKQKKGQGGRQAPSEADEERRRQLDRVREDPFAAMLQARRALESDVKFTLKEGPGIGAAHGGYDRQAENQQFLDDDDDGGQAGVGPSSSALAAAADGGCGGSMLLTEDSLALLMSLPHDERRKVLKQLKREQKERQRQAQLAEAEAVLRAAGIDTSSLQQASAGQDAREGKHKKRKHKKSKAKHKSRHDSSSGSDSSGDDSDSRQQAEARNERRHKPKKSKK